MRKIKQLKGYVIAQYPESVRNEYLNGADFFIFRVEEWVYGEGFRYAEWSTSTMEEAMGWIGSSK